MLDHYFFRLRYSSEIETQVPPEHYPNMSAQKPGLFFSERKACFACEFQDKFGESLIQRQVSYLCGSKANRVFFNGRAEAVLPL